MDIYNTWYWISVITSLGTRHLHLKQNVAVLKCRIYAPQGLSFEQEERKTGTKCYTEIGLWNYAFSLLAGQIFFFRLILPARYF